MKNTQVHTLQPGLCGDNLLGTSEESFYSQSLGKYWQLIPKQLTHMRTENRIKVTQ